MSSERLRSYSVSNNIFDVFVTLVFGVLGYLLVRRGFHPAPVLLGFILGPMMEENLRRSLVIARGDPSVFLERPASAVMLGLAFLLIVMPLRKPALRFLSRVRR
ncbi:hypothetical protein [Roseobacter sp. AzwK-3b]|uniref:hypothetical protein n=1 Tax=Roseobacter sp. AzwK-3b TaxID=351016 RepID=UPI0012F5082F|nr:hypothetical protein [Roseobacter sp. AzwK-3b]